MMQTATMASRALSSRAMATSALSRGVAIAHRTSSSGFSAFGRTLMRTSVCHYTIHRHGLVANAPVERGMTRFSVAKVRAPRGTARSHSLSRAFPFAPRRLPRSAPLLHSAYLLRPRCHPMRLRLGRMTAGCACVLPRPRRDRSTLGGRGRRFLTGFSQRIWVERWF